MEMNITSVVADLLQTQTQTAAPVQPVVDRSVRNESPTAEVVERDAIQPEQVEAAVNQIQQFTEALTQNLKFSIDEDTGKTVVKIVDMQTQEVIRQIPSEEAIKIASTLGKIQGVLFNGEA